MFNFLLLLYSSCKMQPFMLAHYLAHSARTKLKLLFQVNVLGRLPTAVNTGPSASERQSQANEELPSGRRQRGTAKLPRKFPKDSIRWSKAVTGRGAWHDPASSEEAEPPRSPGGCVVAGCLPAPCHALHPATRPLALGQ